MTEHPVTLTTIAKAAGVAKSTVSWALRGDPRISKFEIARIQDIAAKMGYTANPIVARLMFELRMARKQKHISALAFVNCSTEPIYPLESNSVLTEIFQGARSRATQLGYTLDLFSMCDPKSTSERLAKILRARNIQGIAFYRTDSTVTLRELDPQGHLCNHFSTITIGSRSELPRLHFATNDQYATALQLGRHLTRLGYSRFGLVMDDWLDINLEYRFAAGLEFSRVFSNKNIPPLLLRRHNRDNEETSKRTLKRWIERYVPQVVVCLNKEILGWVRSFGIRVPEDIGVAFLDLTEQTKGSSGMLQQHQAISKAAVDFLVAQIHRRESFIPPYQLGIMLESVWQSGSTLLEPCAS